MTPVSGQGSAPPRGIDALVQTPIHVDDEILDDLRRRLSHVRWPVDAGNDDEFSGVSRKRPDPLADYWRDQYEWRRWSWTCWHWAKAMEPLADAPEGEPALDVIAPCCPGLGFSTPSPHHADLTFVHAAELWHSRTLSFGFSDHPVGLLTHAVIFRVDDAIGTSMRLHANTDWYPWKPAHDRVPQVGVPTGITFVGFGSLPRAAWFDTDARVADLRDTVRNRR